MRILIPGFVVFVIWSFFATWLYVDVLKPALKEPEPLPAIPDPLKSAADSLAKIYAMMPEPLMINFEFDKTRFIPDPQKEIRLTEFKSWLDKYPQSVLLVTGHTDLVGTREFNFNLGLERAQVVGKHLESKGFSPSRMELVSQGEDQPVASYITSEGRALNRRTEISIKK